MKNGGDHFLILFTLATLLSAHGCTWKMARVGERHSYLTKVDEYTGTDQDVLIEFRGVDFDTLKRQTYFWTTVSRDKLFGNPDFQDVSSWQLHYGQIPKDVLAKWPNEDRCLSGTYKEIVVPMKDGSGLEPKRVFELKDTCAQKEAKLEFTGRYHPDYAPWRPYVRPAAISVGVVTDIVLIPVYLGYYVKCISVGCAK